MKVSLILTSLLVATLTGCASDTVKVSKQDAQELQYFREKAMHTQGQGNAPTIVMQPSPPIIINNGGGAPQQVVRQTRYLPSTVYPPNYQRVYRPNEHYGWE